MTIRGRRLGRGVCVPDLAAVERWVRMNYLAVTATIVTLSVSAAYAQPSIGRGTNDLSVHISPDLEGAVGDMIFARVGYGRFVKDRFELRGLLSHELLEDIAGEDEDYRSSELGVAADYHLQLGGRLVPWFGLGLGWRSTHSGKLEESALVYGPRVGLGYFIADNAALDLEATYKMGGADVFINDFVAEDTDLTITIGFRVFF
jgi:hypothetical protein